MTTVRVKNAERMIISVKPAAEGIFATFADGCSGTIPFKELPEVGNLAGIGAIELPNPYEVIFTTTHNGLWNFLGISSDTSATRPTAPEWS